MAYKPLFVSFVLISLLTVNIKGNDTKPTEHLGHQRIIHLIKRGSLKVRESENNKENCTAKFELIVKAQKYRRECNRSMLNMVLNEADQYLYGEKKKEKIPDDVLTTLNNEYSRFCIAKCIEPYLKYYQCRYTGEELTYYKNVLQSYNCGRQNGDFCSVLYLRHYATIKNISDHVYNECTLSERTETIDCSYATPSCTNSISRLNESIGCCTQPWLGDLSACNIDSLSEPCKSAVSSGTNNNIAPAIVTISLVITIVGLHFPLFFNYLAIACELHSSVL